MRGATVRGVSRSSTRPRLLVAAALLLSCKPERVAQNTIGPEGGVVTSDDDGFTMILWPGALGEYVDFVVTPAVEVPMAFGDAYAVTPNPDLGIAATILLRGDLPDPPSLANVGALDVDATAWRVVPRVDGGVDANDETVRAYDAKVAAAYAMLDMGGTTEPTGTTSTETIDPTDPTGPPLSFAADIEPILQASCLGAGDVTTGCHGMSPSGGLSLDTNAYENIVGVPALVNGSFVRVASGAPDDSLLLLKVEGTPPPGTLGPMPPAGLIAEESQAMIRSWIAQDCPP